jgi:hypothetical protein
VLSDICNEDGEKRDYVISISRRNTARFRLVHALSRVIALHLVLLYYVVEKLVSSDELRAATYID